MEAVELMVGDYVKCNPHCLGHRVDYISELEEEVGVDGEILSLDMIEPIPLTQEILKKNEFTLKEEEKGMYGVAIAPYYTRDDVPFEIFCDGEPFAIWFKDPVNIKYVHELQHALRLCGIKKEIIL